MTDAPSVGTCLAELLDQLGIATAHFAGRGSADLKGFLSQHPERAASLTVLCPAVLDTRTLALLGERLLVVTGDRGPGARRVRAGLPELPQRTQSNTKFRLNLGEQRVKNIARARVSSLGRPPLNAVDQRVYRRVTPEDSGDSHEGRSVGELVRYVDITRWVEGAGIDRDF